MSKLQMHGHVHVHVVMPMLLLMLMLCFCCCMCCFGLPLQLTGPLLLHMLHMDLPVGAAAACALVCLCC